MGDTSIYQYPVAVQWDLGPERLKKQINKLLVYFQSKKKSGGGDCVIKDPNCRIGGRVQGYVLIHFTQETAQQQVLERENHNVILSDGTKLQLTVKFPGETNRGRETISPLPVINLLMENVSKKQEDRDFQVEMIPEIYSAAVTFTCDIDIPSFLESFSSSLRVNQLNLTAKVLEKTESVRAEKLPPNTSETYLVVYFESPRLGGLTVKEVSVLPEEEAAIVTFGDKTAAERVLDRRHVFGEKPISVYPHYVSLGITLYGKNGPSVTLPQPLEFPISPYILEFILRDTQIKLNIDKKMSDLYCDITWPDPNCSSPTIQLSITSSVTSHLRTMAKVVPTWTDRVSNEFSLTISKFKVAEFIVNASVWEAIREEVSSSTYEEVLVKPVMAEQKVFLAGISKDISNLEQTFRDLVKNTTKEVDRENKSVKKHLPISPALYEMMSKNGLQRNLQESFPKLKISYDAAARNIQLHGLKEEVYGSQCEILSMEKNLKHKPLIMETHILKFLAAAGHEELSCLIFIRHNINAMVQVEGDTMTLTGWSTKDLTEAEKQMNRELLCQQVHVENEGVINGTEWQSLKTHLCKTFNAEKCTIVIEESSRDAINQVVITGLTRSVEDACRQVRGFVEQNTPTQKDIQVTSVAARQLITEKMGQCIEEIKMHLQIKANLTTISIQGPRLYVQQAAERINNVISSLHCDVLNIIKPGAKKFCMKNKEMQVTTAKNKYDCVIHLQEDGEGEDGEDGEDGFLSDVLSKDVPHYQVTLQHGVSIAVYKGDLTRHCVDVVVNASNEDLKHIGGLAFALMKSAGPQLQTDCDHIIKTGGRLSVGECVITDGGNLPCKQVIHIVGPKWDPNSREKCESQLRKAIFRTLKLAAENGHCSIGIPAVSSGIFGFPLELCVKNILESIEEYLDCHSASSCVKQIHLVDNSSETVQSFTEVARSKFEKQNIKPRPRLRLRRSITSNTHRKSPVIINDKQVLWVYVAGQLILLKLLSLQTDVIVNSVGSHLNLHNGNLCRALLHRAGLDLQDHLHQANHIAGVKGGSVLTTDGCNLECAKVFHAVLPQWDGGVGASEKILRKVITTCLTMVEQQNFKSISFPAIGTGTLGFPSDVVAAALCDEILQFSCKNKVQSLTEVNIVLPPTFFGMVTNPTLGVHEMKIGPVTYQVKTGDITKETTEVIVNSTNDCFTLQTGVSKSILDAAGPAVYSECQQVGSQNQKSFIVTQSGNLQCKSILHLVGQTQPNCIKKSVLESLQECERLGMTSVAFPAIGTGAGGVQANEVSEAMLEGVTDYVKSQKAPSVRTVKIVIFQQHMLNDFYTSMKGKEGTVLSKPKSVFRKIKSMVLPPKKPTQKLTAFQLMDNIDPAIIHLCADNRESVSRTRSWLEKLILEEQGENILQDEWIAEFEERDKRVLSDLQKKLQVSLEYNPVRSTVKVTGLTRDVMEASRTIQTMVNQIRDNKSKEREAELFSNLVEWRYHNGRNMVSFDKLTNLQIEEATNDGKTNIVVSDNGRQLTINTKARSATDSQGNAVEIERAMKQEGESLQLPVEWDPMGKDQVKVVTLVPGSNEYAAVQAKFAQTCRLRIQQIERIQNLPLWQNYQIRKKYLDGKNGNTNNEKQLFHGTDPGTVPNVNQNGFNRSFAGRNAANYGNGTYFAVNAKYSSCDTYSKPHLSGIKQMYLARVLTGDYCAGQSGMIIPPPKNPLDPTNLYDSVTDNTTQPNMFVIFNDIQAYPEYLITFFR
ncbi:hypothetical protein GDO86_019771 [Hymenochirus boettgeri]|uniref:Poly [ADP-ribose] polymerase n=1 Tax=Hymenochirus boettgeri TaxID=247094 RepID=A0A8T2IGY4_9PIPI|nr:hypothetical protein GDO86_019771 [Hymenochirus boettgeri]